MPSRRVGYRPTSNNPYLNEDAGVRPTQRRATARGSSLPGNERQNTRRTKDERSHRPVRKRGFRWYYLVPVLVIVAVVLAVQFWPQASEEVARGAIFPVRYSERIVDSCKRHDVNQHLVCAIIKCESGWDANAVSSAGARGLMQVMEETAEDLVLWGRIDSSYDPHNLTDPATNIEFGCSLLDYLDDQLATEDEVIAAYNAGPGAVEQWNAAIESGNGDVSFSELITFPETKNYLEKVKEAKAEYERLYPNGIQ